MLMLVLATIKAFENRKTDWNRAIRWSELYMKLNCFVKLSNCSLDNCVKCLVCII